MVYLYVCAHCGARIFTKGRSGQKESQLGCADILECFKMLM